MTEASERLQRTFTNELQKFYEKIEILNLIDTFTYYILPIFYVLIGKLII